MKKIYYRCEHVKSETSVDNLENLNEQSEIKNRDQEKGKKIEKKLN